MQSNRTFPQAKLSIIDLSCLTNDNNTTTLKPTKLAADINDIGNQIKEACISTGFFLIINHGIPKEILEKMWKYSKRFFELPIEEKLKYKNVQNRGYFTILEENLNPTLQPDGDFKEGLDLGREIPQEDPDYNLPFRLSNKWPSETLLPGFKESMLQIFNEYSKLGFNLLKAFANALGVEEAFFTDKFKRPMTSLRLLRYPQQTGPFNEAQLGCGAHTDYGCFTFLSQRSEGLQIYQSDVTVTSQCDPTEVQAHPISAQYAPNNGQWVSVPNYEEAIVVNIGDMMARLTNLVFKSTLHRVFNPTPFERFSTVFFFDLDFDAEVDALPAYITEENPKKFEKIVYGDHLKEMYNSTFYLSSPAKNDTQS